MSPGLSVGYEAKRVPIVAKQNEVRRTPMTSGAIVQDPGAEDDETREERDRRDPDAVQEPAQALTEDDRVQGDRGGDEPVKGFHPALDRDRPARWTRPRRGW